MSEEKPTVIKIGSAVLANSIGDLNKNTLYNLVRQVCVLIETGVKPVIVTSGAIATGRSNPRLKNFIAQSKETLSKVVLNQLMAACGQAELIGDYLDSFRAFDRECAQVLVTSQDFSDPHCENMKMVMQFLILAGIVPIVNENDVLSQEEIGRSFGDNDVLATALSLMLDAKELDILTDVDGVMDGPPKKESSVVIPVIRDPDQYLHCLDKKSGSGRGGMKSKLVAVKRVMSAGISARIINGKTQDILIKTILAKEPIGTYFPASKIN